MWNLTKEDFKKVSDKANLVISDMRDIENITTGTSPADQLNSNFIFFPGIYSGMYCFERDFTVFYDNVAQLLLDNCKNKGALTEYSLKVDGKNILYDTVDSQNTAVKLLNAMNSFATNVINVYKSIISMSCAYNQASLKIALNTTGKLKRDNTKVSEIVKGFSWEALGDDVSMLLGSGVLGGSLGAAITAGNPIGAIVDAGVFSVVTGILDYGYEKNIEEYFQNMKSHLTSCQNAMDSINSSLSGSFPDAIDSLPFVTASEYGPTGCDCNTLRTFYNLISQYNLSSVYHSFEILHGYVSIGGDFETEFKKFFESDDSVGFNKLNDMFNAFVQNIQTCITKYESISFEPVGDTNNSSSGGNGSTPTPTPSPTPTSDEKLDNGGKADGETKSGDEGKSGGGTKSGDEGKSGGGTKSSDEGKSGGGTKSSDEGKSGGGTKSGDEGKSGGGTKSGDEGKSGGGTKSSDEDVSKKIDEVPTDTKSTVVTPSGSTPSTQTSHVRSAIAQDFNRTGATPVVSGLAAMDTSGETTGNKVESLSSTKNIIKPLVSKLSTTNIIGDDNPVNPTRRTGANGGVIIGTLLGLGALGVAGVAGARYLKEKRNDENYEDDFSDGNMEFNNSEIDFNQTSDEIPVEKYQAGNVNDLSVDDTEISNDNFSFDDNNSSSSDSVLDFE